MITVVDYKVVNLGSILNMIKKVGGKAYATDKPEEILKADKILLPGVGSFERAIHFIESLGLKEALWQKAMIEKVPFLGVCVGMQLMTQSSEESSIGKITGLGFVPAKTIKFRFASENNLKIPHMGWNRVKTCKSSLITDGFVGSERFYFVHSYHVSDIPKEDVLLETNYGYTFTSGFQRENLLAFQFHPEKSHKYGMQLFKNFVEKY